MHPAIPHAFPIGKPRNQLAAYSALAGAFIALSPAVGSAQVVYTDLDPDVLLHIPFESQAIDFDNDGNIDLYFGFYAYSSTGSSTNGALISASGAAGFAAAYTLSTSYYFATKLTAGATIGPALDFKSSTYGYLNIGTFTSGGVILNSYGAWLNAGDGYIGARFQATGGTTHYGWVRLDAGPVGPANKIIIKDFAYESTPDTPIKAGDTGMPSGIPESASLEGLVNMYVSGSELHVRTTEIANPEGTVEVFNTAGQQIAHFGMANPTERYDLRLQDGIYLVRVILAEGVFTRQVYLHDR